MILARSLALSLLTALTLPSLHAQDPLEARTVIPTTAQMSEGNTFHGYPWGVAGNRTLCLYGPELAGTEQTVRILGVRFRPDGAVSNVGADHYKNVRIDVSTAVTTPATFVPQFSDNHGADRTRVYDDDLNLVA